MAQGSEPFKWNLFPPDIPKICGVCKKPLRVKDVGEHRTVYTAGKGHIVFWCNEHRGGRS